MMHLVEFCEMSNTATLKAIDPIEICAVLYWSFYKFSNFKIPKFVFTIPIYFLVDVLENLVLVRKSVLKFNKTFKSETF